MPTVAQLYKFTKTHKTGNLKQVKFYNMQVKSL